MMPTSESFPLMRSKRRTGVFQHLHLQNDVLEFFDAKRVPADTNDLSDSLDVCDATCSTPDGSKTARHLPKLNSLAKNVNVNPSARTPRTTVNNRGNSSTGQYRGHRIVIPLLPGLGGKTDRLPEGDNTEEVINIVKSEYSARYCEMIGVTPTHDNMHLIQKKIPLESCGISYLYNSCHGRNNIVIDTAHVNRTKSPRAVFESGGIDTYTHEIEDKNNLEYLLSPRLSTSTVVESYGTGSRDTGDKLFATGSAFIAGERCESDIDSSFPSFEDYKWQFVFPFNLHDKFIAKSVCGHGSLLTARKRNPPSIQYLDNLSRNTENNIEFSAREGENNEIKRELIRPCVSSSLSDIYEMQRKFVNGFPWIRLSERLSPNDISSVKNNILSNTINNTLYLLVQFLLRVYVQPFAPTLFTCMTEKEKEDMFLQLAENILVNIPGSNGIEYAIHLLCMRVIVYAEMVSLFPKFINCVIGSRVHTSMDSLLIGIADPTGLMSRLSVFESTPQALKMARIKKQPKLCLSSFRSPLADILRGKENHHSCVPRSVTYELKKFITPSMRGSLLEIFKKIVFRFLEELHDGLWYHPLMFACVNNIYHVGM